jgi:recombination protein RecR
VETYPSRLVEDAVNEISRLPGIGRRTALRLALHLLKRDLVEVEELSKAIVRLRSEIKYCSVCNNISNTLICDICDNPSRDHSIICVVEDARDVMAVEKTTRHKGVYHVLGGIISPIDGIGPLELNIETLVTKIASGNVREIIMALPATIEGDTTIYYLYKKVKGYNVIVSTIARGVAVGDDLEFTDEITLGRSIINRTPYTPVAEKEFKMQ